MSRSESPYYHLGHYYDALSTVPAQMSVSPSVLIDHDIADEKGSVPLPYRPKLLVRPQIRGQVHLQDDA